MHGDDYQTLTIMNIVMNNQTGSTCCDPNGESLLMIGYI